MQSIPELRVELRRLLLNFAAVLGTQTGTALLQLAAMALIAREWGPAGNGTYVVALLLPTMLASFLNLGVNVANVYFLGNGEYSPRHVLRFSLRLSFWLGLAGVAVGAVLIAFYGPQLFPGIETGALWVALAAFPVMLVFAFMVSIFQGLQTFRQMNICYLLQPAVTLAALLLLLALKLDSPVLLVACHLTGTVAAVLCAAVFLHRLKLSAQGKHQGYFGEALGYGYKVYLSNVLTLVQAKTDTYLVNMIVGPAAAGVYSIAIQLGEKLWMLSHAVSVVLMPRLSGLGSHEERRIEITTVVSRLVLGVSLLGCAVVVAVAYPVIVLLFGEQYRDTYLLLLLLLPGVLALAVARVIAHDIAARGQPELNLYMAMVGVVLTVCGDLVALPLWGVAGAAAVTSLAYCADLLLKLWVYQRLTGSTFCNPLFLRATDMRQMIGALRSRSV